VSQTWLTKAFVSNVLFWLFFVLVLSETVLVLVIDLSAYSISCSATPSKPIAIRVSIKKPDTSLGLRS
jgi:hypothetical protein